jgi:hypothetical protein
METGSLGLSGLTKIGSWLTRASSRSSSWRKWRFSQGRTARVPALKIARVLFAFLITFSITFPEARASSDRGRSIHLYIYWSACEVLLDKVITDEEIRTKYVRTDQVDAFVPPLFPHFIDEEVATYYGFLVQLEKISAGAKVYRIKGQADRITANGQEIESTTFTKFLRYSCKSTLEE